MTDQQRACLLAAAALSLLVLGIVPLWGALGVRDAGGHAHGGMAMDEAAFQRHLHQQQRDHGLPDGSVRPPPGGTVYVMARQYAFEPRALRLRRGAHYHLTFYAADVLHGATFLQDGAGSLNVLVAPQRMTEVSLTPARSGEIRLVCNEFCGIGHHLMRGRILVEEAP